MRAALVFLAGIGVTIYAAIGLAMISIWLLPGVLIAGGGVTGLIVGRMIAGD